MCRAMKYWFFWSCQNNIYDDQYCSKRYLFIGECKVFRNKEVFTKKWWNNYLVKSNTLYFQNKIYIHKFLNQYPMAPVNKTLVYKPQRWERRSSTGVKHVMLSWFLIWDSWCMTSQNVGVKTNLNLTVKLFKH